jgi:hypothetical protein
MRWPRQSTALLRAYAILVDAFTVRVGFTRDSFTGTAGGRGPQRGSPVGVLDSPAMSAKREQRYATLRLRITTVGLMKKRRPHFACSTRNGKVNVDVALFALRRSLRARRPRSQ